MAEVEDKKAALPDSPAPAADKPVNEIMKTAARAKQGEEAAAQHQAEQQRAETRNAWIAAGVGVGSAALMAALLYANRAKNRRRDEPGAADAAAPAAPTPPVPPKAD